MSNASSLSKGISLIIISALLTAIGQLCWKLGKTNLVFLMVGFVLYGMGALVMMMAFKYWDVSVLHPILSAAYVFAIILGYFVLHEAITIAKIVGILLIFAGILFLTIGGDKNNKRHSAEMEN